MPTDAPHITAEQADLHVAAGLPPAERAAVDAHIAHCPTCAAMIANATAADASLRSLLSAVRPSAALEADIVGRLRAAQRMRLSPPARRAAVVAAAAVVVIGTGWLGSAYLNGGERTRLAGRSESDVFIVPSSIAQKWDFGGGAKTALGWPNFHTNDGLERGHGDAFISSRRYGSNVLMGDGHTDWQPNPFTGTQHDNVYTGRTQASPTPAASSPGDATDSILLPALSGDSDAKGITSPVPPPAYAFKPNSSAGAGENVHAESASNTSGMADGRRRAFESGKDRTTEELVQSARQYYEPGQYSQSLAVIDQIQRIDPSNQYAMGTRQMVADKGTGQEQRQYRERFDREFEKTLNAAHEKPTGGKVVATLSGGDAAGDRGAGGGGQPSTPSPAVTTTQPAIDTRKVIRTGTMSFDVDHFDTAADTLAKVVGEAGGFVATVDSQKLPNGKTQGTITVRCPPERLDLLVLSLRSLGDLKSQQIVANDVTKEYTDLEAELTADRAMQDRLLDLIRTGKGSIKDLLAAENELGTWRTKIEKIEGQLRYMNSQIGLSTLAVTLSERDIRQAASTVETETGDMGVETDDVEKARDGAVKAIDDAKGRVVEAELKRLDAGQLAARIVADVPPEMAGATIDRLKQLGRVARLEVHREQTAVDAGTTTMATPARTERKPTRIVLSIYNLANVAPRRSTAVTLAATDPESAYAALLAVASPGGRVVASNLDRSANATGTVSLEVPPARLESALATIRVQGEILKRTTTENVDTQNTTDAKVGLTVSLVALSAVPPRETVQQTVAAADVPTAYRAITSAASVAHAHVRTAELNEQDRRNVTATFEVDVPRSAMAEFDGAVAGAGDTVARSSARSPDGENTADAAVRVRLSLASADGLPARETTTLAIEVSDADKAAADAQAVVAAAGGRVLSADVNRSPAGPATAKVALDVPLSRASDVVRDLRQLGTVRGVDAGRDANAPAGPLAHAHVELTLATADALVADASGPLANVRHGLSVGLTGLLWSLQLIVVGLCLLVPWAAVGYVTRRLWRRWYRPLA